MSNREIISMTLSDFIANADMFLPGLGKSPELAYRLTRAAGGDVIVEHSPWTDMIDFQDPSGSFAAALERVDHSDSIASFVVGGQTYAACRRPHPEELSPGAKEAAPV